jgi:hypothetical protein
VASGVSVPAEGWDDVSVQLSVCSSRWGVLRSVQCG